MNSSRKYISKVVFIVFFSVFVSAIIYAMVKMPLPLCDSIRVMLAAHNDLTLTDANSLVYGQTYYRPLHYLAAKVLLQQAGDSVFLPFQLFNAICVLGTIVLFLKACHPVSHTDFAAFVVALCVLIGMPSFDTMVGYGWPTNPYALCAFLSLLAVTLLQTRGGFLIDLVAAIISFVAISWVEAGIVVATCLVTGYLVGFSGLSRYGAIGVILAVIAYFILRTITNGGAGLPSAEDLLLYGYNISSALLDLLFSQPRRGVWTVFAPELQTYTLIQILSSSLLTGIIGLWAWWRLRHLPWQLDDEVRLFLVGIVVILLSALLNFAYIAVRISSTGGVFYALMAYIGLRWLLNELSQIKYLAGVIIAVIALGLVSSLWSIRALEGFYNLRLMANKARHDWLTDVGGQTTIGSDLDGWLVRTEKDIHFLFRLQKEAREYPAPYYNGDRAFLQGILERRSGCGGGY